MSSIDWDTTRLYGASLMTWAIRWFSMSNDEFFDMYKFNFNPHEYQGLYEEARRRYFNEVSSCV